MAERYRKGSKNRVNIHCEIRAEAKAYLNQLAGEFAIGHAIEQLVEEHRRRNLGQKSNRILPSNGK